MKLIIYSIFVIVHQNFASSYLCPAPSSDNICPDQSEIKYYLYTQNNENYTQIYPGKLADVVTNNECPFVFLTHGFKNNGFEQWLLDMVAQFFKRGCYNVIVIDWSAISSTTNYYDLQNMVYPYTAYRTCCSGENVGSFLIDWYQTKRISFADMHCIGHSLGSHLCGCAGQYVYSETTLKIARISGMDPAGPYFNNISTYCRLDDSDADFVDCMHTDTTMLGYPDPLGHADYYPNGGTNQPGCPSTKYSPLPLGCSHCFSYILYTASITVDGFTSNVCDSYQNYQGGECTNTTQSEMGYDALNTVLGTLYLDTTGDPQYVMNGTRSNTLAPEPPAIV